MTADRLKKIILEEINKNPEIYRKAIAPALAESGLSSMEIVSEYAEKSGFALSKTQISWLIQHDRKKNRKDYENLKKEKARAEKIQAEYSEMNCRKSGWGKQRQRIYSGEDFPEWLIANLEKLGGSAQDILKKAAKEIMSARPDSFPPGMDDMPEQFCVLPEGTFFTKEGYQYLLMTAQSRRWTTFDEWIRWKKESGLFDPHLKESA